MAIIDKGTIRSTVIFTRLNTSVDWYNVTEEYKNYVKTNYVDTGKKTVGYYIISEDGLIKKWVSDYLDQEAKDQWNSDLKIKALVIEREKYSMKNNIKIEIIHESL